jgi:DNA repair protein RadD
MYDLRPYQQSAVEAGLSIFTDKKPRNGIGVLPTGSGKSLVIASVAKELKEPTLVFQPSKEILEQNLQKTIDFGFTDVGVFSASAGRKDLGKITFATIGSVIRKPEMFDGFKNVIMDECHAANAKGGMYLDFFERNGSRVFGVTATPFRMHSSFGNAEAKFLHRTKPKIFKDIVHITQVQELYQAGFLCPLDYHQETDYIPADIKLNSTGMDYDQDALRAYNEAYGLVGKVARSLVEHESQHALVFCVFVEEAEHLSAELEAMGIRAATVSAKTPKREREKILADFQAGYIQVVTNVGVLTTGFDFPELDCVILARPTRSLILYYQMVGRGIRIAEGKENCKLIDICGNVDTFGHIEEFVIKEPKKGLHELHSNVGKLTAGGKGGSANKPRKSGQYPEGSVPFGKHAGTLIVDLPQGYIEWCAENFEDGEWRDTFRKEILRRQGHIFTPDNTDSIDNDRAESTMSSELPF